LSAFGGLKGHTQRIKMLESKLVIKPPRLKRGDKIGVISPAGPVNQSDLQPGLKILRSSGFEIHLGSHVYNSRAYLAGGDEVRLKDFHNMFRDPEIAAIFCARGGYGSPRLLDMINYDLIKENPKILVGYSDITALLLAIHRKTGLITFHGPMVRELPKNNSRNWDSLLRLLSSGRPLELSLTENTALVPGRAKGPLIGGNLSLICNLLGTPFLPSLGGCILFIEERKEPIYRLDRMLNHLALSGELKSVSGLIAGQFEGCGDIAAINGVLMEIVSDLEIPLATGLPVGHGLENIALPLGGMAVLDTNQMTLSITEACVM
jgi:muramoyltetrapeptide carboxypeptidase